MVDNSAKKIGALIREAREHRRLSQTALADELHDRTGSGYSHTAIGNIERGTRTLSLVEAAHIADILWIDWQQLFDMLKPNTSTEEVVRIKEALDAARATIGKAMTEHLVTAGNRIKGLQERFDETRAMNEKALNAALDRADDDLEQLRDCYASAFKLYTGIDEIHSFYFDVGVSLEDGVDLDELIRESALAAERPDLDDDEIEWLISEHYEGL